MKRLIFSSISLLVFAATVFGADLNGKWSGEVPGRDGGVNTTFVFKVDGEKLTGTMSSPQGEVALAEGKATGDTISFSAPGRNAKVLFQGTVAGDQIKMTRTREGGQAREFSLKRAQ
jgi:hypothetical protein